MTRCIERVCQPGVWSRSYQCSRKNGHGPDNAYCKQHDPIARKAKNDSRLEQWRAECAEKSAVAVFQADCIAAVRKIAEGHNDPRGLCQFIIDKREATQ